MPDANTCTIVIYSFADTSEGVLSGVAGNPFLPLKKINSKLKALVAVGGWYNIRFSLSVNEIFI